MSPPTIYNIAIKGTSFSVKDAIFLIPPNITRQTTTSKAANEMYLFNPKFSQFCIKVRVWVEIEGAISIMSMKAKIVAKIGMGELFK